MQTDIMIDLETMGLDSHAAILSIGAVEMNLETGELGPEFYRNVTLSSCIKLGMTRSQATMDWWAKDENKAARDMLTKDAISVETATQEFVVWCGTLTGKKFLRPWGNGAGFDLPIIENALRVCGREVPWEFYHQSCYRTLKRLAHSINVPRTGIKHNSLDDAKYQARHLMAIVDALMVRAPGDVIYPLMSQDRYSDMLEKAQ